MSKVGKYIWGEYEESYDSIPFDTIEECKASIRLKSKAYMECGPAYIGQITAEFDFEQAARDIAETVESLACEFDKEAKTSRVFITLLKRLLREELEIRNYHVRTIEKVNKEDLR
jgi:hypothetical protein